MTKPIWSGIMIKLIWSGQYDQANMVKLLRPSQYDQAIPMDQQINTLRRGPLRGVQLSWVPAWVGSRTECIIESAKVLFKKVFRKCVPIWCGWRERLMSIRYGKHGLQCLIRQILPEGFVWFFPNSIYPTHNRHVRGGRSASTPVHWGDALMIGKQLSQSCTSVCCKTEVWSPDKICICF